MNKWVLPLSFLIFFELVADFFAKEYSLRGGWVLWCLGILGYIVANAFWLYAIRHGSGLARGAMIFSVGSAVVAVALGVFFFKEHASTLQVAGLVLGLASITLLLWN